MGGTCSGERLRRFEAVTDAALAQLDIEDLLVELLDRIREQLDAEVAVILVLDPSAQQLIPIVATGIEEMVRRVASGSRWGRGSPGGSPPRHDRSHSTRSIRPPS